VSRWAAGITRVSGLHVMRETWCSELLDRGFAIPTVQEMGGWATPDVLLRHYASSSADQRRAAAVAIGELLAAS
jgi:integrase